jgi:hypothetical protein
MNTLRKAIDGTTAVGFPKKLPEVLHIVAAGANLAEPVH